MSNAIKTLLALTAVTLNEKAASELVTIHNTLAGEADVNLVNRFADKKTAVTRTLKMIDTVKALPKYKAPAKASPSIADHLNQAVENAASKKPSKAAKATTSEASTRTKDPRKLMKGERPKAGSTDGKVLGKLEAANPSVSVADIAKALNVKERQVRNSLSYLRRKYGFDISMLESNTVAALKEKLPKSKTAAAH